VKELKPFITDGAKGWPKLWPKILNPNLIRLFHFITNVMLKDKVRYNTESLIKKFTFIFNKKGCVLLKNS